MIQAVVLPGALKRLHIPRRFHHADDRRVPLGAGADGADLGLGVVLADAAAVELGVRVLDGRSQGRRVLIGHAQHLIGHAGRAFAPDARKLAELFDQLFQRGSIVAHVLPSSRIRDPECSCRRSACPSRPRRSRPPA